MSEIPSKTFVRGRGLESEWRGNLTVKGDATAPVVLGSLRVHRGFFDFLDKRFQLRQGTLDFYGASPPLPRISLEAAAAGLDMTAVLRVTGPVDAIKITLDSEPSMPQDEVLARLLFDKKLEEISAVQAIQLAAAVRTLTSGGTSLLGRTRGALGLDTLDVGGSESGGASVKAGKYLSENVYLEVESGITDASSKVRVEMDLTPQISVETQVDQDSNSAFGINWKFDY